MTRLSIRRKGKCSAWLQTSWISFSCLAICVRILGPEQALFFRFFGQPYYVQHRADYQTGSLNIPIGPNGERRWGTVQVPLFSLLHLLFRIDLLFCAFFLNSKTDIVIAWFLCCYARSHYGFTVFWTCTLYYFIACVFICGTVLMGTYAVSCYFRFFYPQIVALKSWVFSAPPPMDASQYNWGSWSPSIVLWLFCSRDFLSGMHSQLNISPWRSDVFLRCILDTYLNSASFIGHIIVFFTSVCTWNMSLKWTVRQFF